MAAGARSASCGTGVTAMWSGRLETGARVRDVSLRTVQRAGAHLRQEIQAQSIATIRFETTPGHQLQIDFGTVRIAIGGEVQKVHLFVATLGYSRRTYVAAFEHQRQSAWLQAGRGVPALRRHPPGTASGQRPGARRRARRANARDALQ